MPQTLTPKFITPQLVQLAVNQVLGMVMNGPIGDLLKRKSVHVVVVVPSMEDARETDYPKYPNYPLTPNVIYDESYGDKSGWTAQYDNVARCKILQVWTGRNDTRTDVIAHLLFSGDAPFYGAVMRELIAVGCSGVQPWFDKMISGMIVDAIIALAYNAWMLSKEKQTNAAWLE